MRSATRRLTLDTLEDRRCPTSALILAGHTLIIRGDNTANTILIQDVGPEIDTASGRPLLGQVTVSIDNQGRVYPDLEVTRVVVLALGGDDSVTYEPDPAGNGTESLTSLVVDLGAGDDSADLTVSRPPGVGLQ